MGYPMTYGRVVSRNDLGGDYQRHPWLTIEQVKALEPEARANASIRMVVGGDLRRLKQDQRDPWHLAGYAHAAGITPEQAKTVLDALFDGMPEASWSHMVGRWKEFHPDDEATRG
jgi:hypothetical protein